mmetsp:Transcript_7291/g.15271  ORF Transcript_7291/g.15271 Transcript_7291/m.15271 type:complete len:364 (+) Transcript_7291:77-1168(+)
MIAINLKRQNILLALLGLLSVAWILLLSDGSDPYSAAGDLLPRKLLADPGEMSGLEKSAALRSSGSREAHELLAETYDEKKSVIFLIAFGERATSTTYVERTIMSLRRRGEYQGRVLLLTDAPDERYDGLFDENVIVMHPKEEHLKTDFDFPAMTVKRFKTYIIDYVDMVPELDAVEWIYYVDIDILFGAPFRDLIQKLGEENKIQGDNNFSSKLYFFKNSFVDQYVAQSGFMIAQRKTSNTANHCLRLWRSVIDSQLKLEHDQSSLNLISKDIESGKEHRCQLVIMEQGDHISFPHNNRDLEAMAKDSTYTSLIHIKNTSKSTSFGEGVHEKFVSDVLMLSDDEMKNGKLLEKTTFGMSHLS